MMALQRLMLYLVGGVIFVLMASKIVTTIVDKKIGDIRVNMPRVKVQAPEVVLHVTQDEKGRPKLTPKKKQPKSKEGSGSTLDHHPNKIQLHEPFLSVRFDDKREEEQPAEDDKSTPIPKELDGPIVVDTSTPATLPRIAIGCTKDEDCNVVHGDGKNVCKADGTCACVGGGSGTFCHYGPVNYRDPRDMTRDELRRFKMKFRSNFTLQDYKNWLMLYKDEQSNLREHHRKNLQVLLQGGQLKPQDIPTVRVRPPTDAADYFQRMYKDGNIAVQFPENSGPYTAANYGKYDTFVPPENMANSWITGQVNLYKEGKDDARALDWYLRPEVTSGLEEQRVGDIANRYIEKQHNLADLRAVFQRTSRPDLYVRGT